MGWRAYAFAITPPPPPCVSAHDTPSVFGRMRTLGDDALPLKTRAGQPEVGAERPTASRSGRSSLLA